MRAVLGPASALVLLTLNDGDGPDRVAEFRLVRCSMSSAEGVAGLAGCRLGDGIGSGWVLTGSTGAAGAVGVVGESAAGAADSMQGTRVRQLKLMGVQFESGRLMM